MNELEHLLELDERGLEAAVSAPDLILGVDVSQSPLPLPAARKQAGAAEPSILQALASSKDWQLRDPGNISEPLSRPKPSPVCSCMPPAKNRIGGRWPSIDLDALVVRCRTCGRPIANDVKSRDVTHLRGLLHLLINHPEMVDLNDCADAGFLYIQPSKNVQNGVTPEGTA